MPQYTFTPFAYDSRSGVLTRNGRYLPIPRQASLLLGALLARPGEVVTRQEIQAALWPDGEFLAHEHAINRAVNNLRQVLGDSARKNRFIETVPKSGYYFAAPVTVIEEEPGPAPVLEEPTADPVPRALVLPAAASLVVPARRRRWTPALVAACLLAAVAVGILYVRHRTVLAAQPRTVDIGMPPFEVQGDDADRVAESLRIDLIDTLAQLPGVQLRASHSLDSLKDRDNVRETARLLNLDVLLLGRLRLQGQNCFVDLELVRGSDAAHIASLQYSGTTAELATIRDRIQRDVFRSLQISGRSPQALRGSTQNPRAYSLYLAGRDLAYQRTEATLSKAIENYREAAREDPQFARAYAGMATAHLATYGWTANQADITAARVAATRALEIDPDLAEAHAILGIVVFRGDWNYAAGVSELRKAIQSEPHEASYHAWLAEVLSLLGDFRGATAEIDLAHADDPLWAQIYNIEVGIVGDGHDYQRAIVAANRAIELKPDSTLGYNNLAWSYFGAQRYEDAIAEWRQIALMEKDPIRLDLEEQGLAAFRKGGIHAYARQRLQEIESAQGNDSRALALRAAIDRHPNDFSSPEWHAFAGDHAQAIKEIRREIDAHDTNRLDLAINPMFDSLHNDPAYQAQLDRLGLRLPPFYLVQHM
jgi:DNA-binding winged helix-turn-helix (wHTH) protein/TolB-like protein/Flp pilus assembly protein TadD